MYIERVNMEMRLRFTLRDSEKYTLNEIARAFHMLGGKKGPILGRSILFPKSLKEEFIFDLTEVE